MTPRARRMALSILGIGISALFLWLAVRRTDLAAIGASLTSAELHLALPFLLTLFAYYWLKSMRWRDLLRSAADVRAHRLFPIVMVGYAGTAVLPLQMGELVRTWLCGRLYSIPVATVFGSIAIERIFDLLTVLALLAFVIISGSAVPDIFVSMGYAVALLCVTLVVFGVFFIVCKNDALRWTGALINWVPDRGRSLLLTQVEKLADSLESVRSPTNALRIAVGSIVQWLLMGICVAISLAALDISIPPSGVLLVLVATVLGISLPTSPGYVGNIQLAYSLALAPYNVDPADAFAASVFYHVLAYSAVVVVGFYFAHRLGFGFRELAQASEGSDSDNGK